jgi:hypothetical protein
MTLPTLHSLADVAEHVHCSPDWLRRRRREFAWTEGANRSMWFTDEQVEALMAWRTREPAAASTSIATSRRRRAS